MKTIDQFMWGYQTHFRASVEILANKVLERGCVARRYVRWIPDLHGLIGADFHARTQLDRQGCGGSSRTRR
ncbi:hypothetical protein [Metallibacterium scheffleri]